VVLELILKEHEHISNLDKTHHEDFVNILLSNMNKAIDPENDQNYVIDRSNVKAILLDMIVAAVDTSSTTIEWALTELLRHPRVMKNLQDEIQNEVGTKRMVEEKDLKKFNYLDMVIDETLRLYPVAPLLVPRECRESITVDGYFIKEKTRVIVNAWAIGRDSNVWSENVEEFYPERFINKKMNYLGQDFESIPFGAGRRRCPGIQLGLVSVKLVLAQLVHCFNWKLPNNINPSNLNMEEEFGLSIPRAQHLHAIPSYRLSCDVEHE
jgi:cytochrome P450